MACMAFHVHLGRVRLSPLGLILNPSLNQMLFPAGELERQFQGSPSLLNLASYIGDGVNDKSDHFVKGTPREGYKRPWEKLSARATVSALTALDPPATKGDHER